MKFKTQDLRPSNVGQIVELDGGTTFGELSMYRLHYPEHGKAEITLAGGQHVVVVDMSDDLEMYRSATLAHLSRREREEQTNGGVLYDQDVEDIESIVNKAVQSAVQAIMQQLGASAPTHITPLTVQENAA